MTKLSEAELEVIKAAVKYSESVYGRNVLRAQDNIYRTVRLYKAELEKGDSNV